jgi:hypothetical protein
MNVSGGVLEGKGGGGGSLLIHRFTKAVGVDLCRGVDSVVGVRLEAHDRTEEWGVDVGCGVWLSKEHVIGEGEKLGIIRISQQI